MQSLFYLYGRGITDNEIKAFNLGLYSGTTINEDKIVFPLYDKEHFFFALKMSAISIICSNISAGDLPFAYRYAIFCSVYIPILFSYLPMIIERRLISFAVYIPLCVLIWTVLYNKQNDRIYCPQQILPIESILDENYHPYQNPKEVPL